MKHAKDSWKQDVEELLEKSVVEDAVAKVFAKLEAALDGLDEETRDLLARYFEGTGVEALSEEKGLSPEEVQRWIDRGKRELNNHLRSRCAVRQ